MSEIANNKMMWTEKYRPKNLGEIRGQEEAVIKLKDFIKNFGKSKNAILLHGPPGTGKTSLAHALADDIDCEIFELNASDLRNKERLKEVLKPVIEQKSLKKDGKIILVDEVDGISSEDYGGLPELLELIDQTSFPMIITANDVWDKKFNSLRKKCEMLPLKELSYNINKRSRAKYL